MFGLGINHHDKHRVIMSLSVATDLYTAMELAMPLALCIRLHADAIGQSVRNFPDGLRTQVHEVIHVRVR